MTKFYAKCLECVDDNEMSGADIKKDEDELRAWLIRHSGHRIEMDL